MDTLLFLVIGRQALFLYEQSCRLMFSNCIFIPLSKEPAVALT